MFFDSSTESPMLTSSFDIPFSSVSLHINHRAFMHIFTHVTFSYFFFRSKIVDLNFYFPCTIVFHVGEKTTLIVMIVTKIIMKIVMIIVMKEPVDDTMSPQFTGRRKLTSNNTSVKRCKLNYNDDNSSYSDNDHHNHHRRQQ